MNTLDRHQLEAVAANAPVLVCAAAAGSGKTRVLVSRVRRLLADGVPPERIVCITFTNNAAKEMERRLEGVRLGFIGTLHGYLLRMLRRHGARIGLPDGVSVMDEQEAEAALQTVADSLRVKANPKQLALTVAACRKVAPGNPSKAETVAVEYLAEQRRTGVLDYDSILTLGLELMRREPELFECDHVLCDEVQDSAPEDWAVYGAWPAANKFYVGDDSQAIYSFRGGDVRGFVARSMLNPTLKLPVNYRSAVAIVELSQRLIRHNQCRIDNPTTAAPGAEQGEVTLRAYESPVAELNAVASGCAATLAAGRSVACLWRTNAQADQCRDMLRSLGVDVQERRVVQDAECVKLAKAALGYLASPWSDKAVLKLVAWQHGPHDAASFKQKAAESFESAAAIYNRDGVKALADLGLPQQAFDYIQGLLFKLPEDAGYAEALLLSQRREESPLEGGGAFVGTVHSAKGLEWDVVFLGGMEDAAWPGRDDIEESRRLLYVAVTRARKSLHLSRCLSRPKPFAAWQQERREPSRHLAEMGLCGG